MDDKAKLILSSYKEILEELKFDELDILGFLIFIRQYINNEKFKFLSIQEFCDLVAHRNRDRGKVMRSIESAHKKNFSVNSLKKIKGSEGIDEKDWENEWRQLFDKFNIKFSNIILKELTLCIISLAQKTQYDFLECSGSLAVFIDDENNIALSYHLNSPTSLYVVF